MWRKPDKDDIYATISKEEVELYRASAEWSSDPIERLCARAVSMVRDKLRTNGNVRMSPNEGEIPESCISPAMDYLAFDILKRIDAGISEERKQARRDAVDYFNRIAAGKENPESYNAAADEQTGGPAVEIVTSSRTRMDAERLEGL